METKKKLSEAEIINLVKNYLKENPSEKDTLITQIDHIDVDADLDDEINRWAEGTH
jgi:hypothetical protein